MQKVQIDFQSKEMKHKDYFTTIKLDNNHKLENFLIKENVLPPEKVTAIIWARWLFSNKELYSNKVVIDMGSGTGIQGIVAAINGAKKVILSDISKYSYDNILKNVKQLGLEKKCLVFKGDLFEKINEKADIILFNHPFFGIKPKAGDYIALATQDGGELIHRFFEDAKNYLAPDGIIVMPYFDIAGDTNNPGIQAPNHGFNVKKVFSEKIKTILHEGVVSIYVLDLSKKLS